MSYALLWGILTFLAVVPWGGLLIRFLSAHGMGKRIRVDVPGSHQAKMGTPTMGGLLFLIPVALVAIVLHLLQRESLLPLVGTIIVYGVLGAIDDLGGLTRDSNAPLAAQIGILGRHMFLLQLGVAFGIAALLYWGLDVHDVIIPTTAKVLNLGLWYLPVAAFIIVSMVNGVNLTDGLDGLAGGTSLIAFVSYSIIAHGQGQDYLAAFCFVIAGALLAFLWYNVHPAAVFMGGIGSLTLGATLAVVSLLTMQWLLLPVIGLVFVAVALSVVLQVSYFKYTRRRYGEGRRIFKMAPLHHHFEKSGWAEVQITQRFWIVGAVAGMVGIALALW